MSKEEDVKSFDMAIKALEQEPCEMTAEEYRQRMIQAFHNTDCDELIALCVLPTEKEFEHLEWLLKNHYKKEPCEDAISRDELLKAMDTWDKFGYTETGCFVREPKNDCVKYIHYDDVIKCIKGMSSVTPQQRTGRWIDAEVLDKIRAEIDSHCSDNRDRNDGLYIAMKIIDKYKAESEDKE